MPLFQQRRNPVSGGGGFLSLRLSLCISRCFHYPFLAALKRHRLHPFHDLEIKGSHTIYLPGCSGLHDNTIVRRYTFLTRQDGFCMNFSGVFTKGRMWMYQTLVNLSSAVRCNRGKPLRKGVSPDLAQWSRGLNPGRCRTPFYLSTGE
jgi:hypothetical protein